MKLFLNIIFVKREREKKETNSFLEKFIKTYKLVLYIILYMNRKHF